MPTYMTLIEFTAESEVGAIQEARDRYEEAVALVESQGGEVKATYYGDIAGYDALTITEFPDRESLDKTDILYSMSPAVKTDVTEVQSAEAYLSLVEETLGEHGDTA